MKNSKTNNVNFISTNTGGLVSSNDLKEKEVVIKTKITNLGFAQASPEFKETPPAKAEASEEDKKTSLEENIVDKTGI